MSDWHKLLSEAVAASSPAAVARSLKISRCSVVLLLHGKYPANTARMEQRIMRKFGAVVCPVRQEQVNIAHCAENRRASMPTSSPDALRQWRQCQQCREFLKGV